MMSGGDANDERETKKGKKEEGAGTEAGNIERRGWEM